MKKNILLVLVLIVIVFGISGFFIFQKSNIDESLSSGEIKPSAITVTALEQDVFRTEKINLNEVQIENTSSTTEGDVIRTSATGRALIEASKAHPTILDYSSSLAIVSSEDEGNKTTLELFGGALWSRAKKSAEKGEFYQIKTGNAVAVVRGTSFGLSYGNNKTLLQVATGTVYLYTKDKKTGEPILDTEVIIVGGNQGIVEGTSTPTGIPLTEEDKKGKWFIYNSKSEIESDTSKPADSISDKPTSPKSISPSSITPPPPKNTSTSGGTTDSSGTTGTQTGSVTPVKRKYSDSVNISAISPQSIEAGDNKTFVTLRGKGFLYVANLSIAEDVPPDFKVVNDNLIQFHIGTLDPDKYDIYFIMKDDSDILFPGALIVTSPRANGI